MLKLSREAALFAAGGMPGQLVDAILARAPTNFPGWRRWRSPAVAAGSAIPGLVIFSTALGVLFKRSGTAE